MQEFLFKVIASINRKKSRFGRILKFSFCVLLRAAHVTTVMSDVSSRNHVCRIYGGWFAVLSEVWGVLAADV